MNPLLRFSVDTDVLEIDAKGLEILREHKVFVELTEEEAAFHAFKERGGDAEGEVKVNGAPLDEKAPVDADGDVKAAAEGKSKKTAADQDGETNK